MKYGVACVLFFWKKLGPCWIGCHRCISCSKDRYISPQLTLFVVVPAQYRILFLIWNSISSLAPRGTESFAVLEIIIKQLIHGCMCSSPSGAAHHDKKMVKQYCESGQNTLLFTILHSTEMVVVDLGVPQARPPEVTRCTVSRAPR